MAPYTPQEGALFDPLGGGIASINAVLTGTSPSSYNQNLVTEQGNVIRTDFRSMSEVLAAMLQDQ